MSSTFSIRLDLVDDVVISSGAATAGPHEGLDYIPGTALRGAAATQLFARPVLDAETAALVLHSGKVIFDDALPLAPGTDHVGLPVPMALHHPKDCSAGEDYARTVNFVRGRFPEKDQQAEQWRSGYVTAGGAHFKVKDRYVLKTGIQRETGRAATGQLFGHHRIAAGQRFLARVTCADGVDPALRDVLLQALSGDLLLGRSRSAEVGRVMATPVTVGDEVATAPEAGDALVTVWLLSDTALLDDYGRPTYLPSPAHFGLEAARFRPERSFLRTQRRSWFNAALGTHESEQFVLGRGSVLTFAGQPGQPSRFGRTGAGQTHGLGRFVVNHPFLAAERPAFHRAPGPEASAAAPAAALSPEEAACVAWMKRAASADPDRLLSRLQEAAARLDGHYRDAATLEGSPRPLGPTRSQWNAVFALARASRSPGQLRADLFGEGGLCTDRRSEMPLWSAAFPSENGHVTSFTDWFKAELDGLGDPGDLRQTVQLFAREARMVVERLQRSGKEAPRDAG